MTVVPLAPNAKTRSPSFRASGKGVAIAAALALLIAAGGLFWRQSHYTPPAKYVSASATRGDITRVAT
uniref:hypothetical protein n=1 Tax=uncultured Rhodoblastus sp. TaxID=543037 RepID=UPI0025E14C03